MLSHGRIEVEAGDGVAVAREGVRTRPSQLEDLAEPIGPQAVVAMSDTSHHRLEAHIGQLTDRPRRQAIAAGLGSREGLLLEHRHRPARLG